MSDTPPNPELLRSLGRLARGLSALFWGLPAALIVSVRAAKSEWPPMWMIGTALALDVLLLYGLWEMGAFQKQERPWHAALDRARLLALVNLGLSPFLYWANRVPAENFFDVAVLVLGASAILFLFNLNIVLERLGAMLPDETLRHETKQFTAINRGLLVSLLLVCVAYLCCERLPNLPVSFRIAAFYLDQFGMVGMIVLVLLPLAMTMALIWKTKEVILESVFGGRS
ncbi:MAG: hypothetical protein EXS35_05085 [Pedosphaera sp.]|nr:hypothetical protein [Pedosphaera sp.]